MGEGSGLLWWRVADSRNPAPLGTQLNRSPLPLRVLSQEGGVTARPFASSGLGVTDTYLV